MFAVMSIANKYSKKHLLEVEVLNCCEDWMMFSCYSES
jgi:hypothetical protein